MLTSSPSDRVILAGDPGNLGATPGSRPWAIAVRAELRAGLHETRTAADVVARYRVAMETHGGYQQLANQEGQPFNSFAEFCAAPPPYGLGCPLPELDRTLAARLSPEEWNIIVQPLKGHGGMREQGAISTLPRGSTHASYLTARLKRDRPDIIERMRAGEFNSVHQAALEAGIVKRTATIVLEPEAAARTLRRHFTADEVTRIVACLVAP